MPILITPVKSLEDECNPQDASADGLPEEAGDALAQAGTSQRHFASLGR